MDPRNILSVSPESRRPPRAAWAAPPWRWCPPHRPPAVLRGPERLNLCGRCVLQRYRRQGPSPSVSFHPGWLCAGVGGTRLRGFQAREVRGGRIRVPPGCSGQRHVSRLVDSVATLQDVSGMNLHVYTAAVIRKMLSNLDKTTLFN